MAEFKDLIGKKIIEITGLEVGSDLVVFVCEDGKQFKMYHDQDCCESVQVEDVCGDIAHLIGQTVLSAEESSNNDDPPAFSESHTWTFYRIATNRGMVVIRWLGESNGYYAESVDFEEID